MRGAKLTYGDFTKQGYQDAANVFSISEFEDAIEAGGTPEEIVKRTFSDWEDEGVIEEWIEQQHDFDDLDPYKAYDFWKSAWFDYAVEEIRVFLEEDWQRKIEETEMWYLEDDQGNVVEKFDDINEALGVLARLPKAQLRDGDGNGPSYKRFVWAEPDSDDLKVDQFATVLPGERKAFHAARVEARSRGFRRNPRNPYDVRSSSGHEQTFAREEDADFEADELRRAGARDVHVVKRARGGSPAATAYRKANPHQAMNEAEASMQFYDLIKDPDPASMEIAQDLVLEYHLSLAKLSKHAYLSKFGDPTKGFGAIGSPALASGLFSLAPSFATYELHPATSVMWSLDYSRRLIITWAWNVSMEEIAATTKTLTSARLHYAYGRGHFRTYDEAERAGAADAWAVAKFLKYRPADTKIADLVPMVDNIVNGSDSNMMRRSVPPVPRELYEHRDAKQKKRNRTYAEAQDAALAALARAGWHTKGNLKIPQALSPNLLVQLWFKPQAVYLTKVLRAGESHSFRNAFSISYGLTRQRLPDMRSMSGSEFVDKIYELFPKSLGPRHTESIRT